jgi:hypothetical protein
LLIQQISAQIAAAAIEQAGLHGRLAHAFQQFPHEKGLELLGCFADSGRIVARSVVLERCQPARVCSKTDWST